MMVLINGSEKKIERRGDEAKIWDPREVMVSLICTMHMWLKVKSHTDLYGACEWKSRIMQIYFIYVNEYESHLALQVIEESRSGLHLKEDESQSLGISKHIAQS